MTAEIPKYLLHVTITDLWPSIQRVGLDPKRARMAERVWAAHPEDADETLMHVYDHYGARHQYIGIVFDRSGLPVWLHPWEYGGISFYYSDAIVETDRFVLKVNFGDYICGRPGTNGLEILASLLLRHRYKEIEIFNEFGSVDFMGWLIEQSFFDSVAADKVWPVHGGAKC